MSENRTRIAVAAAVLLGCGAVWRATLAFAHYRASLAIVDDPSIRELEEVDALFELGLAVVLLLHALAASWFVRHRWQLDRVVFAATGVIAATGFPASVWQVPVLETPGLLIAMLVAAGAIAGYRSASPWVSAYLGALLGGVVGFWIATPEIDPFAGLAVTAPAAVFALVGVAAGRGARRLRRTRDAGPHGSRSSR